VVFAEMRNLEVIHAAFVFAAGLPSEAHPATIQTLRALHNGIDAHLCRRRLTCN